MASLAFMVLYSVRLISYHLISGSFVYLELIGLSDYLISTFGLYLLIVLTHLAVAAYGEFYHSILLGQSSNNGQVLLVQNEDGAMNANVLVIITDSDKRTEQDKTLMSKKVNKNNITIHKDFNFAYL